MALPRTAPSSWTESLDIPNGPFETRGDDYISAEYTNGVLEIRPPIAVDGAATGTEIQIQR
ncbi:hypothetical protein SAMN05216226_103149 [Halovenus aranensis]|uniref:Hsp20/alpha crystallin family protein n=1 Tax=Halovenus aranensis TaxID=890420 RepID=A0A1G8TM48_9EURY|nr:hypothetical protein [Halovenus aranensis]SDJ42649.1 hypothetical protein SAMN05216226_103149 [Halovenus aranensis]